MSSIQDALVSVNLEKYLDSFVSGGFLSLDSFVCLAPGEIEKILTDIGMLKGHTFKFKKLIEDAKQGIMPKPAPQAYNYPPPRIDASVGDLNNKVQDLTADKDFLNKASLVKSQLTSIVESKDYILTSLKQFADLDLEVYQASLVQLKSIQQSVMELLNTDVDMPI
jgi:hypothetical protein